MNFQPIDKVIFVCLEWNSYSVASIIVYNMEWFLKVNIKNNCFNKQNNIP